MSKPAGYLDWKGLLRECAEELGLDLDREHDLVALAQYCLNQKNGERGDLTAVLRSEFDKRGRPNETHAIIWGATT
jgi:hypothetical protein